VGLLRNIGVQGARQKDMTRKDEKPEYPMYPAFALEKLLLDGIKVRCVRVDNRLLVPRICDRYVEAKSPNPYKPHEFHTCMNCRALGNCTLRDRILAR